MRIDQIIHDGVGYSAMTPDELLAAGVPQAAIDAALGQMRLAAVKAECLRRIYALASAETQMNMTAAATVVSAKSASSRSTAEQQLMSAYGASVEWVKAMRDAVGPLAANTSADYRIDSAWPACPADVLTLVAQF